MDVAVMLAERAVWLDVVEYKRGGSGPFGRDGQAGWALLVAMPDSVRMRLAEEAGETPTKGLAWGQAWLVAGRLRCPDPVLERDAAGAARVGCKGREKDSDASPGEAKDEATQSDVEGAVDENEEQLRAVTYRWLQRRPWIAGLEQQLCPSAREGARADDAADSQTGFWKNAIKSSQTRKREGLAPPCKPAVV
ncbi:hypothetical protein L1887_56628 [Cichorium endivia]|nr:hypothetical protein L1887_56628 [Cichorium endivia]